MLYSSCNGTSHVKYKDIFLLYPTGQPNAILSKTVATSSCGY